MTEILSHREALSPLVIQQAGLEAIRYIEKRSVAKLRHDANRRGVRITNIRQLWHLETTATILDE